MSFLQTACSAIRMGQCQRFEPCDYGSMESDAENDDGPSDYHDTSVDEEDILF
ncbi:hypothetical protein F444_16043 [Phytophthora nicotianae P1976]|uniref:Uncharacterized protein n=1 Tax=Phytophthora nicotianae P1976 TaxID=1317066 RepID=A0A080ZJT9_PHYNI|nr:hypothetical protein F444_16043 [Phytophthora nicotianae P1976]